METLFDLPPKAKKKLLQKRMPKQQEICKRCKHSCSDYLGAYCNKFDLCIDFEDGIAKLSKNNQPLSCDKENWSY